MQAYLFDFIIAIDVKNISSFWMKRSLLFNNAPDHLALKILCFLLASYFEIAHEREQRVSQHPKNNDESVIFLGDLDAHMLTLSRDSGYIKRESFAHLV